MPPDGHTPVRPGSAWATAGAILPPPVAQALPGLTGVCPSGGASFSGTGACSAAPAPFPYYGKFGSFAGVNAAAKHMSDRLLAYIKRWMAHKASAHIPPNLLPDGLLPQIRRNSFTLVKPGRVRPRQQWGIRKAFDYRPGVPYQYHGASPAAYPDPHTTYFYAPVVFLPFGSKVIVKGRFPHARFFDLQPSPTFYPTYYREMSFLGNQETPIVDADINPDRCSVNPFRVWSDRRGRARGCTDPDRDGDARHPGRDDRRRARCARFRDGDRNAPKRCRGYTVTFTAAMGEPTKLDRSASFPFRQRGNRRHFGPIQFQGPVGCDKAYAGPATGGGGLGCFDVGDIWGRYYGPDPRTGGFAGVGLPKITYQLPDGRKFYIKADFSALQRVYDEKGTPPTGSMRAPDAVEGATEGWHKSFSILRIILEDVLRDSFGGDAPGAAVPDAVDPPGTGSRAKYVRDLDHGDLAHDEALPNPNNTQHGATEVPYIDYLIRILAKETGHVVVITGKLPTFPSTRRRLKRMVRAQMRYLSFTGYSPPLTSGTFEGGSGQPGTSASLIGTPLWSVADDQIKLGPGRHYALVLSDPADRPSNATNANHVTWINYGPTPEVHITLRWMTIKPQWSFAKSPTQDHIGWETDLASVHWDPKVIQTNDQSGFLGQYQPVIHYMTTAQFQALGNHFDLTRIPAWRETVPGSGR